MTLLPGLNFCQVAELLSSLRSSNTCDCTYGLFVGFRAPINRSGGLSLCSSSKPAVPSFNIEKSKTRVQSRSPANAIRSRGGYCTCARVLIDIDGCLFSPSTIHVGSTDLALTSTRALRPGCQRVTSLVTLHTYPWITTLDRSRTSRTSLV